MKANTTTILQLSIAVCCLMFMHFAEAQVSKQSNTPAGSIQKLTPAQKQAAVEHFEAAIEAQIKTLKENPSDNPELREKFIEDTKKIIQDLKNDPTDPSAGNGKIAPPPPKPPIKEPVELKPKLSPEEEAKLNDFNKFTTDSPDKYSERNNYNQRDGVFKWKNGPSRKEGESEFYYRRRVREWEDSELNKETDEKILQEFYQNIERGRFPKATESVDDQLSEILDKGKADIDKALNQRMDSLKSEQSKLANTGGLASRVDSNLRNVSSPTLGIVLNGVGAQLNGVAAQLPVTSRQSGTSTSAPAKMSPAERQQALQKLRALLASYKKIRAEDSCGLYGMTPATLEVNIRNVEDGIRQLEAM